MILMNLVKQKSIIFSIVLIINGMIGLGISIFIIPDIIATLISIIGLLAGILIPIINLWKEIKFPFIPFAVILIMIALGILYIMILVMIPGYWMNQFIYLIFYLSLILFLVFLYITQKKSSY